MKIEKINENQIKCTLEQEDLTTRGIIVSELAYGSSSAKSLFHEVMQQAFTEFGFVADDASVMVEAIPMSSGKLILLVTKILDSDELDTRFSKFSPENEVMEEEPSSPSFLSSEESTESEAFIPLPDMLKGTPQKTPDSKPISETTHIYSFNSLASISELAVKIKDNFKGSSSVYKDTVQKTYYLVLEYSATDKDKFKQVSNFLTEYSTPMKGNYATLPYIKEHYETIVKEDALLILSAL